MTPDKHDNPSELRVSKWKMMRHLLPVYFLSGIVRLIFIFFSVLKWMFAPLAIIVDVFLIFPFGKFTVTINRQPGFRMIQQEDLPDCVWAYFEDSVQSFSAHGFTMGQYILNDNSVPQQAVYGMTMINREQGIGVGFLYIKMLKARDDSFDLTTCEFTCIHDGVYYDLHNNKGLEPFMPIPGRVRISLEDFDDEDLLKIAKVFHQKIDCRCDDELLSRLESNARQVMNDELHMSTQVNLDRGYMYQDKNDQLHLTWKGAWISTLQTLWPMSVIYRHRLRSMSYAFLSELGIDPQAVAWEDEEDVIALDNRIDNVAEAIQFCNKQARLKGIDTNPVLVSLSTVITPSGVDIRIISIRYDVLENFPDRKCYRRSLLELNIDNDELQLMLVDQDNYMLSYNDYEDYVSGDPPGNILSGEFENLVDIESVLRQFYKTCNKHWQSGNEDFLELQLEDNRMVWTIYDYDAEEDTFVKIDAMNSELIQINNIIDKS